MGQRRERLRADQIGDIDNSVDECIDKCANDSDWNDDGCNESLQRDHTGRLVA